MKFVASKLYDGFSTCFRQHRAFGTHCSFLHGYAISFRVTYEGPLDYRNWVFDFGGMKRSTAKIAGMAPNDYFSWLLDHTVLMSEKDPELETFKELDRNSVLRLRILPEVGCERLAEHLFKEINDFLLVETSGRVRATRVEVIENNKNAAGVIDENQ